MFILTLPPNDPVPVNTAAFAPILPTFALPEALIVVAKTPVVLRLPTFALPVAVIIPAPILPTLALPVVDNVAAIIAEVPKLPTFALPVEDKVVAKTPVVPILPILALPVADIVVENTPVVSKLATFVLPDALRVPAMLAPIPVITTIFALPAEEIFTLPFAVGMFTLLFPLAIDVAVPPPKVTGVPLA